MDREEQRQFNQMQKSIQELLAMVCSMAGVISQLPGADKIDVETAVGIGNNLMPPIVGFQMQTVSAKTAASIVSQARGIQAEQSHKEQA